MFSVYWYRMVIYKWSTLKSMIDDKQKACFVGNRSISLINYSLPSSQMANPYIKMAHDYWYFRIHIPWMINTAINLLLDPLIPNLSSGFPLVIPPNPLSTINAVILSFISPWKLQRKITSKKSQPNPKLFVIHVAQVSLLREKKKKEEPLWKWNATRLPETDCNLLTQNYTIFIQSSSHLKVHENNL